jgi:hypothetical protein
MKRLLLGLALLGSSTSQAAAAIGSSAGQLISQMALPIKFAALNVNKVANHEDDQEEDITHRKMMVIVLVARFLKHILYSPNTISQENFFKFSGQGLSENFLVSALQNLIFDSKKERANKNYIDLFLKLCLADVAGMIAAGMVKTSTE